MKPISLTVKGIWIAFVVCVGIVAGTYHSLFSYVAFVLSLIAVVALSEENALSFLMLIMPFANIFKGSPGTQSFFTYLILFYVLWYFVKHHYIHKTFFFSLLCFFVFIAAQMVVSVNVLRFIKFITNLLLVYIAVNLNMINNNRRIYLYYVFGVVLSSLVAVLNIIPNLSNYIGTEVFLNQDKLASRFTGLYTDPNYYAINVIISLCLLVILNHKKQLAMTPFVCLAVPLVIFAGLTLSKSAFLMLILPVMLLLYSRIKKRKYFVFVCFTVACVVFVTAIFSGKFELFNGIIYRLSKADDLTSLTTGRYRIWKSYIAAMGEDSMALMFGRGLGAGLVGGYGAHNTYIDMIYFLGIVGTILLLSVLWTIINTKKNTTKRNLFNYSIWFCVIVMYFFLSELFYFDWAFHIIIAILISRTDMSEFSKNKTYMH